MFETYARHLAYADELPTREARAAYLLQWEESTRRSLADAALHLSAALDAARKLQENAA
jgi:hypothetical protein